MPSKRRWDPCVAHAGADVDDFLRDYFGTANRKVLFVAGAGFDPRATAVGIRLAQAGASVRALLIREERPNPAGDLISRASGNAGRLTAAFADHEMAAVAIFGSEPHYSASGGDRRSYAARARPRTARSKARPLERQRTRARIPRPSIAWGHRYVGIAQLSLSAE